VEERQDESAAGSGRPVLRVDEQRREEHRAVRLAVARPEEDRKQQREAAAGGLVASAPPDGEQRVEVRGVVPVMQERDEEGDVRLRAAEAPEQREEHGARRRFAAEAPEQREEDVVLFLGGVVAAEPVEPDGGTAGLAPLALAVADPGVDAVPGLVVVLVEQR